MPLRGFATIHSAHAVHGALLFIGVQRHAGDHTRAERQNQEQGCGPLSHRRR
jgi:hypothetical protein